MIIPKEFVNTTDFFRARKGSFNRADIEHSDHYMLQSFMKSLNRAIDLLCKLPQRFDFLENLPILSTKGYITNEKNKIMKNLNHRIDIFFGSSCLMRLIPM